MNFINKVFRTFAVIGFVISLIGIFMGYWHQAVIAAMCIILYLLTRYDTSSVPKSVKNRNLNINGKWN